MSLGRQDGVKVSTGPPCAAKCSIAEPDAHSFSSAEFYEFVAGWKDRRILTSKYIRISLRDSYGC